MEQFYVFMLAALFLLAIVDLVVGVSNDAVNFLNSAVGSKAASFRTILIVASLGVAVGAVFSSGLMEVARKGIFNPWQFTFDEIMILFLAVMITDVLLLDLFNSFALPTSTTVSIVFELLGASMAISAIKILNAHDTLTSLSSSINWDKVVEIVLGILLSVLLAFFIGAIVQWFSRLLFSSGFQKQFKLVEPIFGGVALTSISYFILIKGLKGVAIFPASYMEYADQNGVLLILSLLLLFTIVSFLLAIFTKINILRVIVLAGTFALALAFAGNDLVNFIGVPIAALQSYELWEASYLLDGTLPNDYTMEALATRVNTPSYLLGLSGFIMVVALWWSKKARSVMQTEIDLSRSGAVTEKFDSNFLSRIIVRTSLNIGYGLRAMIPKGLYKRFQNKLDIPEVITANSRNERAFDMVRASVNLMVASILISWATTIKLPLSTTYVTFMVAMGSSLADRAWGRESAVYRVAGVLNVIGGWFVTALLAFVASGVLAVLIYYGRLTAVVILLLATAILLTRSYISYKKKEKIKHENFKMERTSLITINEIMAESSDNISRVIKQICSLYSTVVDNLGLQDLNKLRKTKKQFTKLESEVDELKGEIFYFVKSLDENSVSASKFYILILDYLQDMVQSIGYIRKSSYAHVNNNHRKLKFNQIRDMKRIEGRLQDLYTRIVVDIESNDFKDLDQIIVDKKVLLDDVSGLIQKQVERIRSTETSPKNTKLYFSLLLETKDLIDATINLLTLFKEFYQDYKNIQRM
ncbi:anion permease [Galbibacter sp.]|uniref:inorganic phosphate transporter n=1 Tax=Galbibacter sp. TaxID=2918471 RepID=UPI003A8D8798